MLLKEKLFFAPYKRKFLSPYITGHDSLIERNGVIIKLGDYYAEASPLPGWHTESAQDVIDALLEPIPQPNSLAFAISLLLLRQQSAVDSFSIPIAKMFDPKNSTTIPSTSPAKVKIFPSNAEAMLPLIISLLECGNTLRLDANLSFTKESFECFFRKIPRSLLSKIECIEDPFPEFYRDFSFIDSNLGLAWAVDMPLLHSNAWEECFRALEKNRPLYFVIKPSLIGDWQKIYVICSELEQLGSKYILSLPLESEVGALQLLFLQSKLPKNFLAPGLGLENLWAESLQKTPDIFSEKDLKHGEALEAWLKRLDWQEAK